MKDLSSPLLEMVYTQMGDWFEDWCSCDERIFPLDLWELEYVRENAWEAWCEANEHIERRPEIILKEREVLDFLLLTTMEWNKAVALREAKIKTVNVLSRIRAAPQTDQHSTEWHHERAKLLTASEFSYVIGTAPSQRKATYVRKFLSMQPAFSQAAPVSTMTENGRMPATLWGHRFEHIARVLSSKIYFDNANIIDGIGRIVHPVHRQLAASPDGIIESGPRSGHLLELKCPISRHLDQLPYEYYCQMQIQMEVTDCPVAEYVEMKFMQSHSPPTLTDAIEWCGVLAVINTGNGLRYDYGPIVKATPAILNELQAWVPSTLQEGEAVIERAYWWLVESQWETVHRNAFWWNEAGYPGYQKFWADWDTEYEKWCTDKAMPLFLPDDDVPVSSGNRIIVEKEDVVPREYTLATPCIEATVATMHPNELHI